jgi:hypothetical protein
MAFLDVIYILLFVYDWGLAHRICDHQDSLTTKTTKDTTTLAPTPNAYTHPYLNHDGSTGPPPQPPPRRHRQQTQHQNAKKRCAPLTPSLEHPRLRHSRDLTSPSPGPTRTLVRLAPATATAPPPRQLRPRPCVPVCGRTARNCRSNNWCHRVPCPRMCPYCPLGTRNRRPNCWLNRAQINGTTDSSALASSPATISPSWDMNHPHP